MSGIKAPILDVLNRLKSIDKLKFVRIWNNQIDRQDDGSGYSFPRPAAFVEVVNAVQYEIIGLGFRSSDIAFRIHLVHDYFNGGEMEQDLEIFDLRDAILETNNGLSQFCPTGCGTLNCVREEQEYDHDNTYHYTLDFVCNFTDTKGSRFDSENDSMVEEETEIDLTPQAEYIIPNS